MFKKSLVVLLISFFAVSGVAFAKKIGDVNLPDELSIGQEKVILSGAGYRKKMFIELYVGGLYIKDKGMPAQEIFNADAPMAITLDIVSGMITSEKMVKAINEGFDNATDGNIAPIKKEIDAFIATFNDETKEGDNIKLIYTPGVGVSVEKNGASKATIAGLPFKKALFGIWLCDKPADDDLKEEMLGK